MREESCKNCAHYPGCLTHSAAIFFYFVATGRDRELPADKSDFNARGFCGSLFKEKDANGVLQTKVNRKNEKSPAKFTRPKMGITKQAGEKSHRQPG